MWRCGGSVGGVEIEGESGVDDGSEVQRVGGVEEGKMRRGWERCGGVKDGEDGGTVSWCFF